MGLIGPKWSHFGFEWVYLRSKWAYLRSKWAYLGSEWAQLGYRIASSEAETAQYVSTIALLLLRWCIRGTAKQKGF